MCIFCGIFLKNVPSWLRFHAWFQLNHVMWFNLFVNQQVIGFCALLCLLRGRVPKVIPVWKNVLSLKSGAGLCVCVWIKNPSRLLYCNSTFEWTRLTTKAMHLNLFWCDAIDMEHIFDLSWAPLKSSSMIEIQASRSANATKDLKERKNVTTSDGLTDVAGTLRWQYRKIVQKSNLCQSLKELDIFEFSDQCAGLRALLRINSWNSVEWEEKIEKSLAFFAPAFPRAI